MKKAHHSFPELKVKSSHVLFHHLSETLLFTSQQNKTSVHVGALQVGFFSYGSVTRNPTMPCPTEKEPQLWAVSITDVTGNSCVFQVVKPLAVICSSPSSSSSSPSSPSSRVPAAAHLPPTAHTQVRSGVCTHTHTRVTDWLLTDPNFSLVTVNL